MEQDDSGLVGVLQLNHARAVLVALFAFVACADHKQLALEQRMAQTRGAAAEAQQSSLGDVVVVGAAAAAAKALAAKALAAARGQVQIGALGPSKFA